MLDQDLCTISGNLTGGISKPSGTESHLEGESCMSNVGQALCKMFCAH